MTIPARLLINYIQTDDSWQLRDASGKPKRPIGREELRMLSFAGEVVFGVGSKTRLRFVQYNRPIEELSDTVQSVLSEMAARKREAQAAMAEAQDKFKRLPIEAPYVALVAVGEHRAYTHLAHRCSAAAPWARPISQLCL